MRRNVEAIESLLNAYSLLQDAPDWMNVDETSLKEYLME